jgi:hypothetical protein
MGSAAAAVSLDALVHSPSAYADQSVATVGYVTLSNEGNLLCEDLDRGDAACVQLVFDMPWSEVRERFQTLEEHRVRVEGTFHPVKPRPFQGHDQDGRLIVNVGLNLNQLLHVKLLVEQ